MDKVILPVHVTGVLSKGDRIKLTANSSARFLLLAGKPINEPEVQHGPFVMNTHQQIEVKDYRNGALTK